MTASPTDTLVLPKSIYIWWLGAVSKRAWASVSARSTTRLAGSCAASIRAGVGSASA